MQHVEGLWQVLDRLQDQRLLLQESQFQIFTKHLEILVSISTPEGLSADPLKAQKIFEFPEPRDDRQL